MRREFNKCAIVLIAGSIAALSAIPATGQSPLYQVGGFATSARSDGAIEERVITIAPQLISPLAAELELELLNGVQVVATRSYPAEYRGPGDLTWRGLIDGTYHVTLTRQGNWVAGFIETEMGPHSILPGDRGTHTLALLDQALLGECGNDGAQFYSDSGLGTTLIAPDHSTETANAAGTVAIDILALYTPQARQRAGGSAQIRVAIQGAVDLGNTAFMNSASIMRLQLVHTAEANYNDSGNELADLNWMRTSSQVQDLRFTWSADLVGLMVGDFNLQNLCGRASAVLNNSAGNPQIAYQVTKFDCSFDNLTFAHEFGHLVGMNHDPGQVDPGDAIFEYAFGHFDVPGNFRTVMSRPGDCMFGCMRVKHFSNPDVDRNGFSTGIAGQRDNARVADEMASIISQYGTIPSGGPPALTASYIPVGGGPRTEFVSMSADPPSFSFSYDGFLGNFDEQPGAICNDGQNNPNYLKLRYDGAPMASCSYQFSYGGNTSVIQCTQPVRDFLNTHAEVIIRTDRFAIDIDPSSPNFCDWEMPLTDFLRFNTPAWVRLDLTTTTGQSVSRKVNFKKEFEGLP